MTRIFIFLLGFGLCVVGFIYIISYLNLLSLGYNFLEYVKFICSKGECLIGIIGLFIISIVIFTEGEKDDLRI